MYVCKIQGGKGFKKKDIQKSQVFNISTLCMFSKKVFELLYKPLLTVILNYSMFGQVSVKENYVKFLVTSFNIKK